MKGWPGISAGKQRREGRGFMAGDLAPSCYLSEERAEEGGEADVWGQAVRGGAGKRGAGDAPRGLRARVNWAGRACAAGVSHIDK